MKPLPPPLDVSLTSATLLPTGYQSHHGASFFVVGNDAGGARLQQIAVTSSNAVASPSVPLADRLPARVYTRFDPSGQTMQVFWVEAHEDRWEVLMRAYDGAWRQQTELPVVAYHSPWPVVAFDVETIATSDGGAHLLCGPDNAGRMRYVELHDGASRTSELASPPAISLVPAREVTSWAIAASAERPLVVARLDSGLTWCWLDDGAWSAVPATAVGGAVDVIALRDGSRFVEYLEPGYGLRDIPLYLPLR